MTSSQAGVLVFIGVILVILQSVLVYKAFAPAGSVGAQYEYKVFAPDDISFDIEMRNEGLQGWQIASCRRATSSTEGEGASYECIMQRSL